MKEGKVSEGQNTGAGRSRYTFFFLSLSFSTFHSLIHFLSLFPSIFSLHSFLFLYLLALHSSFFSFLPFPSFSGRV